MASHQRAIVFEQVIRCHVADTTDCPSKNMPSEAVCDLGVIAS
jgi:hypothetical protein